MKLLNRAVRRASLGSMALLTVGGLAACGGGSSPPSPASATTAPLTGGTLKPSSLGDAACQAGESTGGSTYAQVAVQSTSCVKADAVASVAGSATGTAYVVAGFSCRATAEASGSPWASAWGGTYYAYSCQDGSAQVAFNWGQDYIYGGSGGSSNPSSTTTGPSSNSSGVLQPAALGEGQCDEGSAGDGTTYAQIAVSGTTCDEAAKVGPASGGATGGAYSIDGFSCTGTKEGSNSPWASAWGGTFYAYSCKDGRRADRLQLGKRLRLLGVTGHLHCRNAVLP